MTDRGADPEANQEIRRRGGNEELARKTRFPARMTFATGS